MTCIVGVRSGREVFLGGDGRFVDDATWEHFRSEPKVWVSGEFALGYAGEVRACQVAKHDFRPSPPPKGAPLLPHMIRTFVPGLRKSLGDAGLKVDGTEEAPSTSLGLVVAVRGHLFGVDEDWSVVEYTRHGAIGCGSRWAIGYLDATAGQPPVQRIRSALACAASHSAGVGRPFTVIRAP